MRMISCGALALALSLSVAAGCSGGNASGAAGAAGATAAGAAQQGAAQSGASLGISDALVKVAMDAAKGLLAGKQTPTPEDKAAAAQGGVDAAAAKAKEEGAELKPEQQTGLLEMLKGAL